MRADRLLSVLMLLQTRGRMTARALATALEVSERTIYRDIEALGMAGVPVYAERGRNGGIALLERYRSDLTGLTSDEARALFALTAPAALDQLGLSREVRTAMRKLAAALPERLRADEDAVRDRIHIDPSPRRRTAGEPAPNLHVLHQALWAQVRVSVDVEWLPGIRVERTIGPLGLVAKDGDWYLVWVADGRSGVYRVDRLTGVRPTAERFERPAGFHLQEYWARWWSQAEATAPLYEVTLRFAIEAREYLEQTVGMLTEIERNDGLEVAVAQFETLEQARDRILSLGGAVEVLSPEALRRSVADFAEQIRAQYRDV